jgi:hypothetical protein
MVTGTDQDAQSTLKAVWNVALLTYAMSCNYRCSCRFPRTVEKENISVYFVTWSIAVEDLSLNVLVPLVTVFHGLRVTNFGHHTGCIPPPHQHSLWHDRIISNSTPSNLRLSGVFLLGSLLNIHCLFFSSRVRMSTTLLFTLARQDANTS